MILQVDDTIQYNRNEEPIILSRPTSDKLLKLDNPADAMALYWFYYYTAKWQYSNTPRAVNVYVLKGLKWSEGRLARAKRDLVHLGLVETVRAWDKATKKFSKPLLKINFIWWDKTKTDIFAPDTEKQYPPKSNGIASEGQIRSTIIRKEEITNSSLSTNESDNDQWVELATFLAKIILTQRKIATSAQKIKTWAKELKKLSTVEKVPFVRARDAMKWYAHNIAGKYTPVVQCGRSFRDKFIKIEAAMGRDNDSQRIVIRTVQGDLFPVKLDPDAQQLSDFVCSVLGNDIVRPSHIQTIINQMRSFYGRLAAIRDPRNERQGPMVHLPWEKFFGDWLAFLREKQSSGFVLRSIHNLEMSDCRWREYIKRCEHYTCYDFTNGKRIE